MVIFVFCLLGMEFFGGAFDASVRTKFDNLYWAFLAVFQVLTTENINSVVCCCVLGVLAAYCNCLFGGHASVSCLQSSDRLPVCLSMSLSVCLCVRRIPLPTLLSLSLSLARVSFPASCRLIPLPFPL